MEVPVCVFLVSTVIWLKIAHLSLEQIIARQRFYKFPDIFRRRIKGDGGIQGLLCIFDNVATSRYILKSYSDKFVYS